MAGQLRPSTGKTIAARRALGLGLALLPVLALHGLLIEELAALRAAWQAPSRPMPERLQTAFVRALQPLAARQPVPATPQPAGRLRRLGVPAGAAAVPGEPDLLPLPSAAALPDGAELLAALPTLPPAPAIAASDADAPGPEWPPSTQLSYRLIGNYRGEVHGQAEVQWIRQGRRYQVHLDVSIGPGFAPLIARRMSSDGLIGPQGITPGRYDEDTRVLFSQRRRASLFFDGEHMRLADGRPQAQPAGVQDAASQFVQLSWLALTGREPLRPGHQIALPLALPRRLYDWRYEVVGEALLDTPMGPLLTWHLRPLLPPGTRLGGDLRAEVWLAPGLQYLPVRLRIAQDEQTFVDLMLKQLPLQAEPTVAGEALPVPPIVAPSRPVPDAIPAGDPHHDL